MGYATVSDEVVWESLKNSSPIIHRIGITEGYGAFFLLTTTLYRPREDCWKIPVFKATIYSIPS